MGGRTIHFYSKWQLEDGLRTMNYLYQIRDYLHNNDIIFIYYCNSIYKTQLGAFAPAPHVLIAPFENAPEEAVDAWARTWLHDLSMCADRFAKQFGFPATSSPFYKDPDLLDRYEELHVDAKEVNVLLINTPPLRSETDFMRLHWERLAYDLAAAGYTIITTSIMLGIHCTRKYTQSIKDIAAISTRAKYIITCPNTTIIPALLNEYTISSVEKWFIFNKETKYQYPNIQICATSLAQVRAELLRSF